MNLNATLFAQIVVFFILAWFTMKFVWPPIMKALDERATKIAESLAEAERARQMLKNASTSAAEAVREGKDKVAELIVRCAMMRKESRGLHYTLDYPDQLAESGPSILAPQVYINR